MDAKESSAAPVLMYASWRQRWAMPVVANLTACAAVFCWMVGILLGLVAFFCLFAIREIEELIGAGLLALVAVAICACGWGLFLLSRFLLPVAKHI